MPLARISQMPRLSVILWRAHGSRKGYNDQLNIMRDRPLKKPSLAFSGCPTLLCFFTMDGANPNPNPDPYEIPVGVPPDDVPGVKWLNKHNNVYHRVSANRRNSGAVRRSCTFCVLHVVSLMCLLAGACFPVSFLKAGTSAAVCSSWNARSVSGRIILVCIFGQLLLVYHFRDWFYGLTVHILHIRFVHLIL